MPEIRIEVEAHAVAVLDGYCSATGKCRTEVLNNILKEWSEKKFHEATVILRVAGCNPTVSESERHLSEVFKK
jgi:DNA integrity scanning protein DisA with diadenylate cyclase activity